MFGRWLRGWQARRDDAAVARRAIPDDLWRRTLVRYPFLQRREPTDALMLRRMTSLLLDRKEFHATGKLRLTNAMVVSVAAQAVLPVLRLGLDRYDGFVGIVLHPDQVVARRTVTDMDGLVHEYDEVLAGEAMQGGPLMLSWTDVRGAGRGGPQGYNVVIHEFAHVLDLADGLADGVPLLPPALPRSHWLAILEPEYHGFCARVERQEETVLDPYGASSLDEFFAVASEAFFVTPRALRLEHPPLYALLMQFYRQDPENETAPARGR